MVGIDPSLVSATQTRCISIEVHHMCIITNAFKSEQTFSLNCLFFVVTIAGNVQNTSINLTKKSLPSFNIFQMWVVVY